MRARSMTRSWRASMPQSQATATLAEDRSGRGTSFQPVPRQRGQFSRAMRDSIRLCGMDGKMGGLGKLRIGLVGQAFLPVRLFCVRALIHGEETTETDRNVCPTRAEEKHLCYWERNARGVARTMAWRGSLSGARIAATRESSCWTTVANSGI